MKERVPHLPAAENWLWSPFPGDSDRKGVFEGGMGGCELCVPPRNLPWKTTVQNPNKYLM